MKLFKRLLFLVLFAGCLIGAARFTHFQTRGFRVSKITDNLCTEQTWLSPSSDIDPTILKQRYMFLGRGLQSFAFVSEDQQYVIKIFNNQHQFRLKCFSLLSHLPFLSSWAHEKQQIAHFKLLRTFTSYKIAQEEFQNESGLLYTHLDPSTHLPSTLTLVDPLNIEHQIDPNLTGFVIQKKATLVYPMLLHYIETGKLEQAKQAITSLINLFVVKYQKGIADNDPLIRTNYGFLNGSPLQIDVGPFTKDPQLALPEHYLPEIHKVTRSLKHWLNTHSPELSLYLDDTLNILNTEHDIEKTL